MCLQTTVCIVQITQQFSLYPFELGKISKYTHHKEHFSYQFTKLDNGTKELQFQERLTKFLESAPLL